MKFQERTVRYKAGPGIGFVPVADFIPKADSKLARSGGQKQVGVK